MKQQFIITDFTKLPPAIEAVKNLFRCEKVMVVTIAEYKKTRTRDQNAMQWAGMLEDFANQGRFAGRTFSAFVWHEWLKERYLPEYFKDGITLKDYVKWVAMPGGNLKMVGSTTQLTIKGMSLYLEECYAYGCTELDIKFSANPRELGYNHG